MAVLVTAFGGLLLGAFDPILGIASSRSWPAPGSSCRSSRAGCRAPRRWPAIASRGELTAHVVDEIGGIADLIALDRAAAHRERVLALGEELDRATDRLAMVRAATTALAAPVREPGRGRRARDRRPARRRGAARRRLPRDAAARGGRLLRGHRAARPGVRAPGRQRGGRAPAVRADRCGARRGRGAGASTTPPNPPISPPRPDPPARIEIRDLRFRYAPDEPWVLDGLSLSIPAGGSLAIVGPSGSGKSTLVNLLLRFWDYDEGRSGSAVASSTRSPPTTCGAMLGVVPQDVHLFNATIRDNLAVADADVTDERIVAACRLAQVHDFIETLPGRLRDPGRRERAAAQSAASVSGSPSPGRSSRTPRS